MMKNYIETHNKSQFLVFETDISDSIDKVAAGMIDNNCIPGIIPFTIASFDDKVTVRYDITSYITLSQITDEYMKRDAIISYIEKIIDIYDSIEDYLIEPESIQLDSDRIYIDSENGSVHMVCLPFLNKNIGNPQLNVFLKSFICRLKFDSTENCDYIGKMLGYLNSSSEFCISDFRYIVENQKVTGSDDEIFNGPILECTGEPEPDCAETVQSENEPDFFLAKPVSDPHESSEKDNSDHEYRLPLDFYADDEDNTDEAKNKTGIFSKLFKESRPKSKSRQKKKTENAGKIKVHYCDSNGEIIGSDEVADETKLIIPDNYPKTFLLRIKNNEKIPLEKNKFRIGTDKKNTDYCINDNNAVSRLHAEIRKKNGSYFLIDRDSTNHTYLNEHAVDSNSEIKLIDKSRIKLANEEFIFYM